MKKNLLLALICIFPLCTFAQIFSQKEVATYCNGRLAYSIQYPKNLLFPQNEPANGDGIKIMSKDAEAILHLYGRNNSLNDSLLDLFLSESSGGTSKNPKKVVTYKVLKEDWFVVSGFDSGKVFYTKTFLLNEQFKTFHFSYPESQRKIFDPVTKLLASSFNGNVKVTMKKEEKFVTLTCNL